MDKTETLQAYTYGKDGLYTGERTLTWMNRSPISGRWQIPAFCTTIEPPKEKEGYNRVFDGTQWNYVEIPQPEPEPEPTPEEIIERKLAELDAQYDSEIARLNSVFTKAQIQGDTDTQDRVRNDLDNLDDWYDEEYDKIVGGDE